MEVVGIDVVHAAVGVAYGDLGLGVGVQYSLGSFKLFLPYLMRVLR